MAHRVRPVDYFNITVNDRPGEAYELLSLLAAQGVNLLAFNAVPTGIAQTQLMLFPAEDAQLERVAKKADIRLDGPHHALMVTGDDELGALAKIHERLSHADVSVFSSTGVADGKGAFCYLMYVRPEKFERAVKALED